MPYYWSPVCWRKKTTPMSIFENRLRIHDFHFWYYFRYWSMHLIAIYSTCSCNITNGASQQQARKEIFLFNKYIMAHYYTLCTGLEKKLKLNGLKYFIFLCIKKISISTRSDCFTNWFLIPSRGLLEPLVFVDFDVDSFVFCYVQKESCFFSPLLCEPQPNGWVSITNPILFILITNSENKNLAIRDGSDTLAW